MISDKTRSQTRAHLIPKHGLVQRGLLGVVGGLPLSLMVTGQRGNSPDPHHLFLEQNLAGSICSITICSKNGGGGESLEVAKLNY